ncbi:MAG: NAD(P)H-hydrate dehydratase [Clostridia bacterium]|nr:NAD(P)H-hydrate dehydratase [Clostridia bacterium]
MIILPVHQIVEYEKAAIAAGIPSLRLIEKAAKSLYRELCGFSSIRIFCGKGNNGADGYALAKLIHESGGRVEVIEVLPPATIEAQALAKECIDMGIDIVRMENISETPFECYVDAILGIGISGQLEGKLKAAVEYINQHSPYTVSADIPSGIDAQNGEICAVAVRADLTVTFTALKLGMLQGEAADYVGNIKCAEVGIPLTGEINSYRSAITPSDAAHLLPLRSKYSHKGTFGTLLVVAGSKNMPGAALLAAKAAYKAGCGLVRVATCADNIPIIAPCLPEAVFTPLPDENMQNTLEIILGAAECCDAVLIGPGLGRMEYVADFVRRCKKPIILDADAINSLSENETAIDGRNICLTPHPKEFARLIGSSVAQIEKSRHAYAEAFARKHAVTLLLKGANTIIASCDKPSRTLINPTSALATAGSGDVCGGIIASFAAQRVPIFDASTLGCCVHALAGICAEKKMTAYSVTASDIIDGIPEAFKEML